MEYSGGCWILGRYGSKQRNLSHSSSYPDFQPESFTARQKITKRPGTDASLYWLPKEIAEMPRLEAPGPRRDDGVDRHPRLRNNAGTGVSGPESETRSRVAAHLPIQGHNLFTPRFGNNYWQSVYLRHSEKLPKTCQMPVENGCIPPITSYSVGTKTGYSPFQ